MGSLTSRPKVPTAPAPVIIQPAPAPAPTPVAAPAPAPEPEQTAEEAAAEKRTENLLRRNRGRAGTIRTSLLGLQNTAASSGERKTLLGQ